MLTIRALTGGGTYIAQHLSANDYYSEQEQVQGHWMGRGAELLGLEGEVGLEQFEAIRQGIDPQTGEFLRPRQSADRFNEQGERTSTARALYDFTVSAPKSVSVQSLVDPRLIEAHAAAVKEMAAEMERLAGARVRQGGLDENRVTGNLVLAAYHHDTSRELDPQLHSHLVAANLTYDGAETRWKALQASEIYEQRGYLTEVYRNALARSVREYGYAIVDRFDNGRERGFEIVGVSAETLETFSQRSDQRDQAIAQFVQEHGRDPSNREIAVLVRETRSAKLTEISSEEVRQLQWTRLGEEERLRLEQLYRQAQERGPALEHTSAAVSLEYAREHVFERVSVAKDYELQAEALRHGRGHIDLSELKTAWLTEESRGTVLKAGNEVATEESVRRERHLIESINQGQGRYERLGRDQEFVVSDRLRPEQKQAVEQVLDSHDFALNLRGAAGAGKTTTLAEIHRGLQEAGHSVLAVAPTRSAVEELEGVGFGQAMTIARLLEDSQAQKKLAGQVLVVDEAGMVSSRQMAELVELAQRNHARLLFSGDTRQLQSVEAGDALRVLEQESRLQSISLQQVQRQTLAAYRQAVEELRQEPARGFAQLEQMGAIREVAAELRPAEVSRAYREALRQTNAQGQPQQVLVVAPSHEEIRRVTEAIRTDRQQAGELGDSETLTRHVPLHWTAARKREMKHYQPGLVLEFHKATRQVDKNESVTVVAVEKDQLTARKETGEEVTLTRRQAQAFSVFERQAMEVAPGDRLLLEANRRETGLRVTNGELVTVAGIDKGRIALEDGRTLPADYRQFTHGYAVTAHRSQGKTVDAVIVSGDRMTQELFYVAATRGRESLTVFTGNQEQLRESIGISGERLSATELARQAATVHHWPGFDAGQTLTSAGEWRLRQAVLTRQYVEEQRQEPEERKLGQELTREHRKEKRIEHGYGIGF